MLLFNHTPSPPDKIRGGGLDWSSDTYKKTWSKSALKVISSLFSKCCFLPIPPLDKLGGGAWGCGVMNTEVVFNHRFFPRIFFPAHFNQ